MRLIPDNPSQRVMAMRQTGRIKYTDQVIFGTGDNLGIPTITGDAGFVRAASAQGVNLNVLLHVPKSFQGI
jgi:hypothetical protein